jgi:hypothetical protein
MTLNKTFTQDNGKDKFQNQFTMDFLLNVRHGLDVTMHMIIIIKQHVQLIKNSVVKIPKLYAKKKLNHIILTLRQKKHTVVYRAIPLMNLRTFTKFTFNLLFCCHTCYSIECSRLILKHGSNWLKQHLEAGKNSEKK